MIRTMDSNILEIDADSRDGSKITHNGTNNLSNETYSTVPFTSNHAEDSTISQMHKCDMIRPKKPRSIFDRLKYHPWSKRFGLPPEDDDTEDFDENKSGECAPAITLQNEGDTGNAELRGSTVRSIITNTNLSLDEEDPNMDRCNIELKYRNTVARNSVKNFYPVNDSKHAVLPKSVADFTANDPNCNDLNEHKQMMESICTEGAMSDSNSYSYYASYNSDRHASNYNDDSELSEDVALEPHALRCGSEMIEKQDPPELYEAAANIGEFVPLTSHIMQFVRVLSICMLFALAFWLSRNAEGSTLTSNTLLKRCLALYNDFLKPFLRSLRNMT